MRSPTSGLGPILFFVMAIMSTPALAGLEGAMYVEGSAQGEILGGNTISGREGSFPVIEMHHLVRQDASGIDHRQFIVTVPFGVGIPLLHTALDDQETLSVEIRFYRVTPAGLQEVHYTIGLSGARLVAAEPMLPDTEDPENDQRTQRVRLRFEYRAIEHHDVQSGQRVVLQNR